MSPEQLDTIIQEAKEEFAVVVGELHPHILEAAKAVLEEMQEKQEKPKLKVSAVITLNLACAPPSWQVEASVGLRRKCCGETHYPQSEETPELPWSEARNN